jgi:hypothetical protein
MSFGVGVMKFASSYASNKGARAFDYFGLSIEGDF